jgi:hypothetical protein
MEVQREYLCPLKDPCSPSAISWLMGQFVFSRHLQIVLGSKTMYAFTTSVYKSPPFGKLANCSRHPLMYCRILTSHSRTKHTGILSLNTCPLLQWNSYFHKNRQSLSGICLLHNTYACFCHCSSQTKPMDFCSWVRRTPNGPSDFPAEAGRYHLLVSLACPFSCRAVILRSLKGLQVSAHVPSSGYQIVAGMLVSWGSLRAAKSESALENNCPFSLTKTLVSRAELGRGSVSAPALDT